MLVPYNYEESKNIYGYYLRVEPFQYNTMHDSQNMDSSGMAYQYTIAYYEEGSFV